MLKIKRYLDFINESLNFIVESDVIYSDKFRSVLKKCNDAVSKKLLDIENKDLNVQSNYFDIVGDKNDTVSFIPDKKAQELSAKQVWNTNRQEIKVGRAVKAILDAAGETFTDKDIEAFVNKYKATIDQMNNKFSNFEIVTGDDIAYWYNKENYSQKSGTLGDSCMNDHIPKYFEIYTSNPDKCALVIYKDPR